MNKEEKTALKLELLSIAAETTHEGFEQVLVNAKKLWNEFGIDIDTEIGFKTMKSSIKEFSDKGDRELELLTTDSEQVAN